MSSIFNDLGKKLSNASQEAVKKAKELAELAKLNGLILEEERKMNKYYAQIGEKYMELYGESSEEPFTSFIKKVNDSKLNIKKYKSDIKTLKNVKTCSSCGATFTGDAAFCVSCGEKQEDTVVKFNEGMDILDEDMSVILQTESNKGDEPQFEDDDFVPETVKKKGPIDVIEEDIIKIVTDVVDPVISGSDL